MSDAVTALGGATFGGAVTVQERPLTGMITVRADLSNTGVQKALTAVTGTDMPGPRGLITGTDVTLAWMSPDEALVLCDYADAHAKVAVLDGALAPAHALVVNVSDARAVFEVTGPHLRDVLAKLTPADMRAGQFEPGEMRRSKLAQVPAAIWLVDDRTARIVCFRSVAAYVFELLSTAADADAIVG